MSNDSLEPKARKKIIPAHLAVTAMRASGYKSTAYALAELIDNSIQAKATEVEVICVEERTMVQKRQRARMTEIAVIDNGEGMTPEILTMALEFGNGMRLADRSGIGRFGMGLPNASISQCRRVDVWTWQAGPNNAVHSYLDVGDIEGGAYDEVPEPEADPVPQIWRDRAAAIGSKGTLIVWSQFDQHRLTWASSRGTLHNTEILIGRIYRKFIDQGSIGIRLKSISDGEVHEKIAVANDPLYLMSPTSTPSPFHDQPMFQRWGEEDHKFPITTDTGTHHVTVRISWARPETVCKDGTNRGATAYGRHAHKNLGLSIVRADRELDLDDNWVNSYDPVERWWGVEVDFPADLDEIFGVTNNKQAATHFARMAAFDWEDEAEDGETSIAFKQRLLEEDDPRYHLIDITHYIRKQLSEVRKRLEAQTKGTRTKGDPRHDQPTSDDRATRAFKDRAEDKPIDSDQQVLDDDAKKALVKDLEKKQYEPEVAEGIAQTAQDRDRKVLFLVEDWEGHAFFKVESKPGGITEIVFNSGHPAYRRLLQVLNPDFREEMSEAVLLKSVDEASTTLRMLFAAWARLEIEEMSNERRDKLKNMRQDWGQMAKAFLAADEL